MRDQREHSTLFLLHVNEVAWARGDFITWSNTKVVALKLFALGDAFLAIWHI